jgi:hypothetical protein
MMRMFPLIRRFAAVWCIGLVLLSNDSLLAQHPSGSSEFVLPTTASVVAPTVTCGVDGCESCCRCAHDRVYLLSTRHLCHHARRISLHEIPFRMWRLDCDASECVDPDQYTSTLSVDRPIVVYIHGNRMPDEEVVARSSSVRRFIRSRTHQGPIDWLIFSWPSERESFGVRDFREKADRCDAQGLYLASFLRKPVEASVPLAMISYSFGARVATGALHALAGGKLAGRQLPEPPLMGADVRVGLVAPAIESSWLGANGYHGRATKNMDRLVLLYNRRDAVLKRYWLIEKVRRETALGFSGPTVFAPRANGTRLPVRSRDCSPSVRLRHLELDYYRNACDAGCDMARMINGIELLSL